MSISSTTRKAGPFTGSGSTDTFPFTFKVFQASDLLVVKLTVSTGVETTLTLTTDYTVSLNANQNTNPGGSIVLTAGNLATGYNLIVTSDIDNLQPTDLTNQGGFYPSVINDSLDRDVIQTQQQQEQLDRSLKYPTTDAALVTTLPSAAQRAGTVMAFDESAEPVAGPSVADVGTVLANIANINTVATDLDGTDTIGTVTTNIADVNTVASNISDINEVQDNLSDINDVADNLNGTDTIGTVAGSIVNVNNVADNIDDVNTTADNIADVNTVAGISSNVTTVATDIANVNTVATNQGDVNTVAANIASVNTAASDIAEIIAVANDLNEAVSEIDVVANNIATVQAVGADLTGPPIVVDYGDLSPATNPATPTGALGTVYAINDEIQTVAGVDSEVDAVANVSGNVTTVAGISGNVTTVAGISNNVTIVSNISTDVTDVAAIDNDISAVAAIDSEIVIAANNVADITNFADVYQGPKATAPSLRNDGSALQVGDLYFNTALDAMNIYTSSGWVAAYIPTAGFLAVANNLSDLNDIATARANLGLSDLGDLT